MRGSELGGAIVRGVSRERRGDSVRSTPLIAERTQEVIAERTQEATVPESQSIEGEPVVRRDHRGQFRS